MEGESLWNLRGPSKRASWLKGYLRRGARTDPAGGGGTAHRWGLVSPIDNLSRGERTILLVAFDLWNRSGDVLLSEVLALSPRLVVAVAGFMEAWGLQSAEAMDAWMARWSPGAAGGGGPGGLSGAGGPRRAGDP